MALPIIPYLTISFPTALLALFSVAQSTTPLLKILFPTAQTPYSIFTMAQVTIGYTSTTSSKSPPIPSSKQRTYGIHPLP